MKEVFKVTFERQSRNSIRYNIHLDYDIRSECFGKDAVGRVHDAEIAIWAALYYLEDKVEFWVNENDSDKRYVFMVKDYGTKRKALSAAKKFVRAFYERNENTIRAFETGGHKECHRPHANCETRKVVWIADKVLDLLVYEQPGWPAVINDNLSAEEYCDLVTPSDIGVPSAYKFDEIKEQIKKSIDAGRNMHPVDMFQLAFPIDEWTFSNCKAEEWLGSNDEQVLATVKQLGLCKYEGENGEAIKPLDLVRSYVMSVAVEIIRHLHHRFSEFKLS